MSLPKHVFCLDNAYKNVSQTIRGLNLFEGSVDIRSVLARVLKPTASNLSLSDAYSLLLKKCVPLLSTKDSQENIKSSLAKIDPHAPQAFALEKSAGIAVRCLFKDHNVSQVKRTFLVIRDAWMQDASLARFFIGNVDLFLIGRDFRSIEDCQIVSEIKADEDIRRISPATWLEVARFLDGGQRLNLSEISSSGGIFFAPYKNRGPYEQHYNQLKDYISLCPNGPLILKSLKDPFFVVHQSPFKEEIIASGQLRMSRGGCIGNLVYTTELLGENGTELGGHALGLLERKKVATIDFKDNLLLLEVKKTGNVVSNWIDKLGRGELVLSARDQLFFSKRLKDDFLIDQQSGNDCLLQYERIFPLLQLALLFSSKSQGTEAISDVQVHSFFLLCDKLRQDPDLAQTPSIFNGIFFEIIKDYILLFQDDSISRDLRSSNSFNMGMQYEIFFTLCPGLKESWDTTKFQASFKEIIQILKERQLIKKDSCRIGFERFVIERLSYYVNVGILEGSSDLPPVSSLSHFEDLCRILPNLSGLLYHSVLKSTFKITPFYQEFSKQVRKEYHRFYKERNIDIAVKCGLARTEEIGLGAASSVSYYDFDIEMKSAHRIKLTPHQIIPNMAITGVSSTNGFTSRTISSPQTGLGV